jgi:lysophospholipase L1-like esterase
VAAEFDVPVAPVFDTFNGPNHDEDPRDKGYISVDGAHPSGEGAKAIAELLRDLGYEPTQR